MVVVNKPRRSDRQPLRGAKAKPDGYIVALAQAGPNIIIPLTAKGANYSSEADHIARIMVANRRGREQGTLPWNNLKEFEAAKKEPGKLVFASPAATILTFAMRNWFIGHRRSGEAGRIQEWCEVHVAPAAMLT